MNTYHEPLYKSDEVPARLSRQLIQACYLASIYSGPMKPQMRAVVIYSIIFKLWDSILETGLVEKGCIDRLGAHYRRVLDTQTLEKLYWGWNYFIKTDIDHTGIALVVNRLCLAILRKGETDKDLLDRRMLVNTGIEILANHFNSDLDEETHPNAFEIFLKLTNKSELFETTVISLF